MNQTQPNRFYQYQFDMSGITCKKFEIAEEFDVEAVKAVIREHLGANAIYTLANWTYHDVGVVIKKLDVFGIDFLKEMCANGHTHWDDKLKRTIIGFVFKSDLADEQKMEVLPVVIEAGGYFESLDHFSNHVGKNPSVPLVDLIVKGTGLTKLTGFYEDILFYVTSPSLAQYFIDIGAQVNYGNVKYASMEMVEFYVRNGYYDINTERPKVRGNILHWSLSIHGKGNTLTEKLKKLVSLGANPNCRDAHGRTAIELYGEAEWDRDIQPRPFFITIDDSQWRFEIVSDNRLRAQRLVTETGLEEREMDFAFVDGKWYIPWGDRLLIHAGK